jgi:hypothetical protein
LLHSFGVGVVMPQIVGANLYLTATLEECTTGDGTTVDDNEILVDYPISTVKGVYDAESEAGTNYFDSECSHDGVRIRLSDKQSAAIGGASQTCYVSYKVEAKLPIVGYPMGHSGAALAVVGSMPAEGSNDTSTDYEEASLTGSADLSSQYIDMKIAGITINQVVVVTDGTDVDLGLYDANSATFANMRFRKETISLYYNSDEDYCNLRLPFSDIGICWSGISPCINDG